MGYWEYSRTVKVSELKGKILNDVKVVGNDTIYFYCEDGNTYKMYHDQDCCESVTIEDICGSIENLIGFPIIMAEEINEEREPLDKYNESYTWTFYKLATVKGYVTLRWYGTSNGYYSESVDFVLMHN